MASIGNTLWTPGGEVPLLGKDVIPIGRADIITLSKMHEFAQNHGLALVCKRCDKSVTGANANLNAGASVACQCREFRYITG
jgi:hypothetical protein